MNRSLPTNARDTGCIPGLGRSHKPRSNEAQEPQLLSLCSSPHAATTEAQGLTAVAPQQEKPPQGEDWALQ